MWGLIGEDEKSRIVGGSPSSRPRLPRVVGPSRWWTDARRPLTVADDFARFSDVGGDSAAALGVAHAASSQQPSGLRGRRSTSGFRVRGGRALACVFTAPLDRQRRNRRRLRTSEFLFGGLGEGMASGGGAGKPRGTAVTLNAASSAVHV